MTNEEIEAGEMGTWELINRLLDHEQGRVVHGDLDATKVYPFRDELVRRIESLQAEVEALKAEAVVMRELCEAAFRTLAKQE